MLDKQSPVLRLICDYAHSHAMEEAWSIVSRKEDLVGLIYTLALNPKP